MQKLYFLGIKGSGMSGLASLCFDKGYDVVGSDTTEWLFSQMNLDKREITMLPFNEDNIKNYKDRTFICGDAFNESNNDEMKYIIDNNINFMRYHDFVGLLTRQTSSVGIAGCHGKTTTTNIFALGLKNILKTEYIIGDGSGVGLSDADIFLVEADEYRNHFLNYNFDYTVVTNIDYDHPDFFNSIEDMKFSFETYLNETNKKAIVWGEDAYVNDLNINKEKIVTYGFENSNDFIINDKGSDSNGSKFELTYNGEIIVKAELPIFGKHMVLNVASLLCYGYLNNLDLDIIVKNLQEYKTPKRRFNISELEDQTIIDDYAHHPQEIRTTYDSLAQKYKDSNRELVAIHMPHTYSRTASLFDGFVEALSLFDKVYVCPIFASPREKKQDISSNDLVNAIDNAELLTMADVEKLANHKNAILAFMSAGNIKDYEELYRDFINGIK